MRAMVFLGSVLYIVGLILTDISYTLVDPRMRLSMILPDPSSLWTDALVFAAGRVVAGLRACTRAARAPAGALARVRATGMAMASLVVLLAFVVDRAARFAAFPPARCRTTPRARQAQYAVEVLSVLDRAARHAAHAAARRPIRRRWRPRTVRQGNDEQPDGAQAREYPRLQVRRRAPDATRPRAGPGHCCAALRGARRSRWSSGLSLSIALAACCWRGGGACASRVWRSCGAATPSCRGASCSSRWRCWLLVVALVVVLSANYHVLGTDKVGQDVLYLTPQEHPHRPGDRHAHHPGHAAVRDPARASWRDTSRGWVDDMIQYLYTTLNSIPGVLLIAAAVLMMQVYIDTHPDLFDTTAERADLRLLLLCMILGVTSWTGLCRLLRGESAQAARAGIRAGGARLRRVHVAHHGAPSAAQRDAHRADHGRASSSAAWCWPKPCCPTSASASIRR